MGKKVIIAEKPSVAREFAKVLNINGKNQNGYIESEEYTQPYECNRTECTDERTEIICKDENGNPTVVMTPAEMADLLQRMSAQDYFKYAHRLSDWIVQKNVEINNCHDTILEWYEKDRNGGKKNGG